MADLKQVLKKIYKPLIGEEFEAEYNGKWRMETENERDVLIVKDPEVEQILSEILKNIASSTSDDEKVWKGIIEYHKTGEYHLYIQPMKELDGVACGKCFTFKVIDIFVFDDLKWIKDYKAGVNIVLATI